MTPRDVLAMMRTWIEAEIKKAEKPFADPFQLTSLSYCAVRVCHSKDDWHKHDIVLPPEAEETLRMLRETAAIEGQVGTYDVVAPYSAIFLINRTLATHA